MDFKRKTVTMDFKWVKRLCALFLLAAMLSGCAGTNGGAATNRTGSQAAEEKPAESAPGVPLMEAIEQSAEKIAEELPKGSRVAIVSFESENENLSEFIMGELTGALFDRGIEVADRQNVELVFKELNFQMSGAVDEDDVKAVGKFLAADMVITGQLIGLGVTYRYRTNALHTEKATHASVTRLDVRGGAEMKSMIEAIAGQSAAAKNARYEVSEDKTPQTAGTFIDRGILFANRGDYEMAIDDFTEALKLNPDIARTYTLRGRALVASTSDVAEKSTDFSEIIVVIGQRTDEQTRILDQAMNDFTQAIRLDPQNAVNYRERGRVHFFKNDNDKAIADFNLAVQLNPNYAEAYNNRGNVYREIGDLDKAIADYSHAIQIDSAFVIAYRNRGAAYHSKGDFDGAIADYSLTMQLNPDYTELYLSRGTAYHSKGDLDQAIADFDQAIQLDPDNAYAYHDRGFAYLKKGDLNQAIADYEAALKIDPNNANVKQRLEQARQMARQTHDN